MSYLGESFGSILESNIEIIASMQFPSRVRFYKVFETVVWQVLYFAHKTQKRSVYFLCFG